MSYKAGRNLPDKNQPRALPKTNASKKYDDVKAVINTGMTVPKLIEQLKNRMPTGEIFRRIRPKKLVDLLSLHAYEMEEAARRANVAPEQETDDSPVPAYHHMHSSVVFSDDQKPHQQATRYECPFLLLDCRDEEDFENCHIQYAKHYPKARLSRATDQFTPEVLSFRGHPQKMIVLYCDYGQTSGEAAQYFAEHDFDNIFLLHGGLSEFGLEFPDLVGPNPPPPPLNQGKKGSGASANKSTTATSRAKVNELHPTRAAQNAAAPSGSKRPWK